MAAKYSFVVLLALVVAAAAAEKKPSFADWLQASTSGAKKAGAMSASPSEYYGEVETVDACLRAVSKRYCFPAVGEESGCSAGCPTHAEFGLTCCDPKHYYNKELNQYLNKPVEVGDCWIEETPIGNIHISDYVSKIAVFTAQCQMNEKSDECGHPFCDKMVLTITGSKYNFSQAVVNNLPPPLQVENTCPPEGDERRRRAAPKAEIQSANSEYGYEYSHEKLWRATSATVYHGTLTVNSRLHNIKFEDGTFQFVSYVDLPTTPVPVHEAEAKDAYVLDPYKVELSFYKPKEY